MKILCLIGSSMRGSCLQASELIKTNLQKLGDIDFETVFIHEIGIPNCLGCHNCVFKGEQFCPHRDTRDVIVKKIQAADGLVVISPIHCMNISVWLKNFFDHQAYVWHRPRYFGKKAMVVTVGGGAGPVAKSTLDNMAQNLDAWGIKTVARLDLINFHTKLTSQAESNKHKSILKACQQLFSALHQKQTKLSLKDIVWFAMWRNSALTGKNINSIDYQYWQKQGWLDKDVYNFYKVSVNPFQKILFHLINYLMAWFGSRVYAAT